MGKDHIILSIKEVKSGNRQREMMLIQKFNPLLQKYAIKLNDEDAIADLTL